MQFLLGNTFEDSRYKPTIRNYLGALPTQMLFGQNGYDGYELLEGAEELVFGACFVGWRFSRLMCLGSSTHQR